MRIEFLDNIQDEPKIIETVKYIVGGCFLTVSNKIGKCLGLQFVCFLNGQSVCEEKIYAIYHRIPQKSAQT